MREIILTDADGCLFDWIGSFNHWMAQKGYKIIAEQSMYTLDQMYDMDHDKIMELVYEFNTSDAMGNLGPCKDSVEYVKKLAAYGYKFVVITSMGKGNDRIKDLRWDNLQNLFGNVFNDLIVLDLKESKAQILKDYDDTIWVEDHPWNAHDGVENGHEAYLIDYAYNRGHDISDKVIRVENWKEIHDSIYTRHVQPHLLEK